MFGASTRDCNSNHTIKRAKTQPEKHYKYIKYVVSTDCSFSVSFALNSRNSLHLFSSAHSQDYTFLLALIRLILKLSKYCVDPTTVCAHRFLTSLFIFFITISCLLHILLTKINIQSD
jgi:hypothetical protein